MDQPSILPALRHAVQKAGIRIGDGMPPPGVTRATRPVPRVELFKFLTKMHASRSKCTECLL
ncbi:protein of unknown function [Burkholderia multivorans]